MAYEQSDAPQGLCSRFPMYKGWYIQKRAYSSGSPIPQF
ncbi:conserved hypothetical protein (plasmid) [Borreliella finlandensis]|uniref:Uncharacterized protein n=1 Tax=Borreliella finlandensis TaxID=498741 RepID=A0A806C3P6_9SPIR|nr:conserved hypothetical protein [Borreliella finlandensis]